MGVFDAVDKLTYLPTKFTFEIESKYSRSGFEVEYSTFINGDNPRSLEFGGDDEYAASNGTVWLAPSVCPPFLNEEKATPQIPKQLKIVFNEKDELSDRKGEQAIATLDFENGLVSIENRTADLTSIYATEQALRFDFSWLFSCKTHLSEADEVYQKSKLIRLLKELADEESNSYNLVGSKTIRGTKTDAFRKTDQTWQPTLVTTIYIAQSAPNTRQIYRVEFEEFRYRNNETKRETQSERVKHLRYDLYQFEAVSDNVLSKTFDVSECVDESMTAQFSLIGHTVYKDVDNIKQEPNSNELKKSLRSLLAEKSSLSTLNFPKIEVNVYQKESIAEVSLVDIVNPLAYFEDSNVLRQKAFPDYLVDVRSLVKCAMGSLKSIDSVGFQYCQTNDETYCDLFTRLAVARRSRDCTTMVKKQGVKNESLDEKLEKVKKLVENKELIITIDDLQIDFYSMHLARKPHSDIDKRTLYERESFGFKIADEKAQKIFKTDDIGTPNDCYEACMNPNNDLSCDTFSFCKRSDVTECSLANHENYTDSTGEDFFERDPQCEVFSVYPLMHFEKHESKQLVKETKILEIFHPYDAKDCSLSCLKYNHEHRGDENHCNSVEFCEDHGSSATCRLSSNLTIWQRDRAMSGNENCNVYSAKHLLNFHQTSKTRLTDFVSLPVDTLDQCATLCEIAGDCDRFNYCEQGELFAHENICRYLSSKHDGRLDRIPNTELESEELGCSSYVRSRTKLGALPKDQNRHQPRNQTGDANEKFSVNSTYALACFLIGAFLGAITLYHCKTSRSGHYV